MKKRVFYATLALCLSVVPVVLGQQPLPKSLPAQHNSGSANPVSPTPQQLSVLEQQGLLDRTAAVDLHMGRYAEAETKARQALSLGLDSGVGDEVLGNALEAQGKDQEALQIYHTQVIDGINGPMGQPRDLLSYALMLLKSGQWAQAVLAYNNALPHLPDVGSHPEIPTVHDGDVIRANSHFSPDVPEPAALATALHIARGMVYNATTGWAGDSLDKEAMDEYAKALQSAPDNALANYYYGVGWQKLSPTERASFGTAQQAKAALQKAVKIGNADVKRAAERALKNAG
jgi:tetratricopeptide (TPR) repeat protein